MSTNGTKAQILISIIDEKNGIKQVKYPDGNIVYCNGDEKREKLAIDYEADLGGEYIFKITTGDGKETEKKIVVINDFEVEVSGISQTGFHINVSLTGAELAKVEEIKYYVNDSISGTSYQIDGTVTGLSDYTKKYVWAEVVLNEGDVLRSNNYKIVYTAHEHDKSCYEYKGYNLTDYNPLYYKDKSEKYKSTVIYTKCEYCSDVYKTRKVRLGMLFLWLVYG